MWALTFDGDGSRLLSGSKGGEVKIWDTSVRPRMNALRIVDQIGQYHPFHVLDGNQVAALTPDGDELFYVHESGELRHVDLHSGRPPRVITGIWEKARTVRLSETGSRLVVGDENRVLYIGRRDGTHPWIGLDAKGGNWIAGSFSRDGERIAAVHHESQEVVILDTDSGEILQRRMPFPSERLWFWNPWRGRVIAAFEDLRVQLFDPFRNEVLEEVRVSDSRAHYFALSPDGSILAAGSFQGNVTLWNMADGRLIYRLKGQPGGVHSLAFSPNGRRLFTASGDSVAIKIWDMATFQEVTTLPGQGSVFCPTQVSSNGNSLLSINLYGGDIYIWQALPLDQIRSTDPDAS